VTESDAPQAEGSTRLQLRRLIEGSQLVICPGVSDPFVARLAEQAGFEMVFSSGAGIANWMLGLPDLGLATMGEILEATRRISRAVRIPVLADIDTGYGGAINVFRTVQEFEAAGAAGVQIEDQVNPKRCGHLSRKEVVTLGEMIERLVAAREARRDPAMVIVGRTDAVATDGLAEAIGRGRAFAEAGADVVFIEAPTTLDAIATIPGEIPAPVLINIVEGGLTPAVSHEELERIGYRIALHANAVMRVASAAARDALERLRLTGHPSEAGRPMLSWADRQAAVGLPEWEALEDTLAARTSEVMNTIAASTGAEAVPQEKGQK
jgi:2-methylisocitrate lyase-like PEP mutase family enzyme